MMPGTGKLFLMLTATNSDMRLRSGRSDFETWFNSSTPSFISTVILLDQYSCLALQYSYSPKNTNELIHI